MTEAQRALLLDLASRINACRDWSDRPHLLKLIAAVEAEAAPKGAAWGEDAMPSLNECWEAMTPPATRNPSLDRIVAPKPVQYEVWINLYDDGETDGPWPEQAVADDMAADRADMTFVECRRIAWHSDGSPVVSDAPDAPWKENSEYWKAKAEETITLLVERNDAYELLLRRVEAMTPVVLDAITWERHFSATASERLVCSVRKYLQGEPATSDSHEAMVDAEEDKYQSYIPIKNCGTCRWENSQSVCGAKDCLGMSQNWRGWEAKHD